MTDVIAAIVILLILGAAIAYIVRAKRRGVKCIGCPAGETCGAGKTLMGTSSCECGCSAADRMIAEIERAMK